MIPASGGVRIGGDIVTADTLGTVGWPPPTSDTQNVSRPLVSGLSDE